MACSNRKSRKNKKNTNIIFGKTDLEALKSKYRFNDHELLEFKQRFNFLSNTQDMLDRPTFRENMGLLGLDTGAYLADRIFAVLDNDNDGYIQIEEYLKYFDILIYGSIAEKHELTFKMIDLEGKGWFDFNEFKSMIMSMLYTWNSLTGSHYNLNQNAKLEAFLTSVFPRFDTDNQGKVTLQNFLTVVEREPQLLEIFDYFNQGILDSVQPATELDKKDLEIIDDLEHLLGQLNKLKEFVGGRGEIDIQKSQILSKSQGLMSKSQTLFKPVHIESFKQPENISPINELKTPIVSSLDSKIKRTIFFEPFKEEDILNRPMIQRQHSEAIPVIADQRIMDSIADQDLIRRKSYIFGRASVGNTRRRGDEETFEIKKEPRKDTLTLDKYKSMEIIYQEGNSAHSGSHKQEQPHHNYSSFRQERPSDPVKMSVFSQPEDRASVREMSFQRPMKPMEEVYELQDVKVEFVTQEIEAPVQIINQEQQPHEVVSLPHLAAFEGTGHSASASNLQTPSSKKLQLRIDSVAIAPKLLESEFDQPEVGGTTFVGPIETSGPITLMRPNIQNTLNLYESLVVNIAGQEPMSYSPPMPIDVSPPTTGYFQRQSTNGGLQTVPIQQLSDQLEVLARETLKIINEVRNKKKALEQPPVIEEGTKKATVQNVPKVQVTDRKSNYVSFGHQNWNLVLNMMLGIQLAVKSLVDKTDNLTSKDFTVKYIFELIPKRTTETKSSFKICTFFDYAPNVFWEIRRLYGIRNDEYLRSIGPEAMLSNLIKGSLTSLSELTSSGKSGSFFYYSADGKYTLKTISRDEFHFLRKILSNYYTHMINNPQTLMIKFFGLHKIRFLKKKKKKEKVYFIIMANVFQTSKEIHIRYDLKGSTKGRFTNVRDPTVAKKDLNILLSGDRLKLPGDYADSFVDIIEKDSKFFEENHIIDYSLLMGVHHLSRDEIIEARSFGAPRRSLYDSKVHSKEGILSWDGNKIYFFGIIDILTHFNAKKRAEYIFKRIALGKGISAVPPHKYAERFRRFIKSLVLKPG